MGRMCFWDWSLTSGGKILWVSNNGTQQIIGARKRKWCSVKAEVDRKTLKTEEEP